MDKTMVILWNMETGNAEKTAFYSLPIKKALICAINQYNGNFNTANYPADVNGIYKSKMIKDRLIYDISENLILTAQKA